MSLNVPSYDEDQFSFGPGRVYIGAAGTTPSTDVGAITEDGLQLEITAEKKVITQGNPKIPVFAFTQAQSIKVMFTGIEWDFEGMYAALGAGTTTVGGSSSTFAFGGDPLVSTVAIHIEHQMAVSGHTMNAYIWKAYAEAGQAIGLGQDEHQFPASYIGMRSVTDWAGTSLGHREQLFKLVRQTS